LFKNTRAVAIATALTAAGLFSAGHPAAAAAAYYNACAVGSNNEHEYLDRTTSAYLVEAVADVSYLRVPHACTGSGGRSWVLPINLQGGSLSRCAAQVGWGSLSEAIPPKFYLTPNDNSCSLYTPTSWPAPILGHTYHFHVNADACNGTGHWLYSVTDGPSTYTYCGVRQTIFPAELWSGFEVWNSADQMGGPGINQTTSDIAFRISSSGSFTYLTSSTVYKSLGTPKTYWVTVGSIDPDGHALISSQTTNH
jgi:hypothetical protein